jgi:uncharacterized protein (DUF3820 family)
MQDITCQNCGLINDYRIQQSGQHQTAYCNGCNKYIKHLPQNQPLKIHFGKYQGREVNSMVLPDEVKYLGWLLTLENLKGNLRAAIMSHLGIKA